MHVTKYCAVNSTDTEGITLHYNSSVVVAGDVGSSVPQVAQR